MLLPPPESKREEPRFCGGFPAIGTCTRTMYAQQKPQVLGGNTARNATRGNAPHVVENSRHAEKGKTNESGGLSKKHFFWFCVPMCRNVVHGDTQPRGFAPCPLSRKIVLLAAPGGTPERGKGGTRGGSRLSGGRRWGKGENRAEPRQGQLRNP